MKIFNKEVFFLCKYEEEREDQEKEIIKLMERDCYRRVKGRLRQTRWCNNEDINKEKEIKQDE